MLHVQSKEMGLSGQLLQSLLALCVGVSLSSASVIATNTASQTCRYIPEDAGWPSGSTWAALNKTVGGRLIATNQQAHVCHGSTYDAAACEALKAPIHYNTTIPDYVTRGVFNMTTWDDATTYVGKPAEMMNAYYQNQSCDPFTPTSKPCQLGNYAVYSINVTGSDDVIAGLRFAKEHNVRLSIKNTGHDYNGKSSGLGSLSLWTHNLKTMEIISQYKSTAYAGPAVKLGAGVHAGDALEYVSDNGYRIVTGECGTVGLSGGYSQGGGHGPLNSAYGLGSDNVLEWELVTGEGVRLVATPEQNSDLYWALAGGGGGTYGVVLSMTTRVHPDGVVSSAELGFSVDQVGNATFWNGVGAFWSLLPDVVKGTKNSVQFNTWNNQFGAVFTLVDQDSSAINKTLAPFLAEFDKLGLTTFVSTVQSAKFLDYYSLYYGPIPYGLEPDSTILNSRIVPESVATNGKANAKLMKAFQLITEDGDFEVACSASDVSKTQYSPNAVLPAWRDSIAVCHIDGFWDYTAPLEHNYATKRKMVDVYAPAFDDATPGSGIYMNEIDPWYKGDFKVNFYGSNYNRLLSIKHQHDPDHLFYGHHAVGSDEFTIDGAGRLCYQS